MAYADRHFEGNRASAGSRRLIPPRLHRADDNRLDTLVDILWAPEADSVNRSLLVDVHIGQAISQLELTRLIELREFTDHLPSRGGVGQRLGR